jgi:preprotein translocase subunit YajC
VEGLAQLLPLVLLFVLFWFLILRPARNKQKAVSALRSSLQVGDSVLLSSGIFGRIELIEPDGQEMRLEIAPGVVVRAHRDAVVSREQAAESPQERPGEPGDGQPT